MDRGLSRSPGGGIISPMAESPETVRLRRQLVAMCFNKSTSRRVPMTMRMLLPTPDPAAYDDEASANVDLLEALHKVPFSHDGGDETPPSGTQLLKLVPPRWNADEQMFQLFCEGRACCMSNKNVQLADMVRPRGSNEPSLAAWRTPLLLLALCPPLTAMRAPPPRLAESA